MTDRTSAAGARPPVVRVVAWELTRACNLSCPYCRAAAGKASPDEMSTGDAMRTVDEIADFASPLVILSGGEPLMRDDWDKIASRAAGKGLPVALATNGTLMDEEAARRTAACGVRRVSISLDFPDAENHDAVRGDGSFAAAMKGVERLKAEGVSFQVNMTIAPENASLVDRMHALACRTGAEAFHMFFIVDVGRARGSRAGLTPEEYERLLGEIADLEGASPIAMKVTCAPQYERIRREKGLPDGPGRRVSRGCLAGTGFLFISASGEVKPCGYFDHVIGRLRQEPLARIWAESPEFQRLRNFENYSGSCGGCEFINVCGGCRARALAATGDFLAPDPACTYNT